MWWITRITSSCHEVREVLYPPEHGAVLRAVNYELEHALHHHPSRRAVHKFQFQLKNVVDDMASINC